MPAAYFHVRPQILIYYSLAKYLNTRKITNPSSGAMTTWIYSQFLQELLICTIKEELLNKTKLYLF
jgi:hypothetical protein